MMQTLSSYCHGDGRKANAELNYDENLRGEELKKKMLMVAAVLCLGLLLGAGSRMAGEFIMVSSSKRAYVMPGLVDARESSDSGEEPEERLIPFSASGES